MIAMELTLCLGTNLQKSHEYKKEKYMDLKSKLK